MANQALLYRTFNPGDINSTEYLNPLLQGLAEHQSANNTEEKVSALMVTRGCLDKVQSAVRSFARQTWGNKELVIVSDDVSNSFVQAVDEARQGACVRIFEAFSSGSLGDLRNFSVARADGEFVCQWDDDDLYHPDRIRASMQVLKEAHVDAVFLGQWILYDRLNGILALSNRRLWEGSMLARKSCVPIYPSLSKAEDTVMVNNQLKHFRVAAIIAPFLYAYCRHGSNTWGEDFFETLFKKCERVLEANEAHAILKELEV